MIKWMKHCFAVRSGLPGILTSQLLPVAWTKCKYLAALLHKQKPFTCFVMHHEPSCFHVVKKIINAQANGLIQALQYLYLILQLSLFWISDQGLDLSTDTWTEKSGSYSQILFFILSARCSRAIGETYTVHYFAIHTEQLPELVSDWK